MGIISGVIESLLADAIAKAIPEASKESKGCFQVVLVIIGFIGVSFFAFIIWVFVSMDDHEKEVWNNVSVGDSLFVTNSVLGVDFYKKGRTKLYESEQRKIKFAREDTISLERVNDVPDKYFYKSKSSFVGICLGLDSTEVKYDEDRWLMIKPAYGITHPPKPKDRFDRETRRWENPMKNIDGFKLSKEFYVKASDITLTNNDQEFK